MSYESRHFKTYREAIAYANRLNLEGISRTYVKEKADGRFVVDYELPSGSHLRKKKSFGGMFQD